MGASMIVDAHVHLGSWVVNGKDYGFDVDKMKELMKSLGVDRVCAVVIGTNELFRIPNVEDREPNNEIVLEVSRKDKSFVPIFWANPFKEEYRKALENGFKGLKYHADVHLLPISDERLRGMIETAEEFGVPLFVHTSEKSERTSIFRLQEVAKKYPDVDFFALHSINRVTITCFEAKKHGLYELENIYYCTGGRILFLELKFLYENVGPERIVFSSDLPFGHPGIFMKYVELLTEDEKERRMMLGKNIQEVLKL